jgi:hypothetical protein
MSILFPRNNRACRVPGTSGSRHVSNSVEVKIIGTAKILTEKSPEADTSSFLR